MRKLLKLYMKLIEFFMQKLLDVFLGEGKRCIGILVKEH